MADISGNPRLIKNLYLDIDGDNYAALVTNVNATSPAAIEIVGGTDDAVWADVPSGGRKLNITGIQDWEAEDSLCNYLLENEGETAEVLFSPRTAGGAFFSCEVTLSAPVIGGQRNTHGTFQLALPILGAITTAAAPTPPAE